MLMRLSLEGVLLVRSSHAEDSRSLVAESMQMETRAYLMHANSFQSFKCVGHIEEPQVVRLIEYFVDDM